VILVLLEFGIISSIFNDDEKNENRDIS
jgi:hypothetical protein